jgi:adenosylhomocysteine nucleosidase
MALPIEAGYLCDRLTKVRKYTAQSHTIVEGELSGKLVAVILSGVGMRAARHGGELLIAGHRPRLILSAGFAGGLDPSLKRNDLVMPHEIVDLEGNLIEVAARTSDMPASVRTSGRLLTVDRVITRAAEKTELRGVHQADLLDMETSGLAHLARERSLPFVSMRVISDDAAVELAPEIANLLTRSGSYQLGLAVRAIWRRPAVLKDFWALHGSALEASDRLAKGVQRLLEILPMP